jgi:glycosyltransferase involved in cell wall biosynthesis
MGERRILLISEWYPPAYKAGGPIQSIYGMALLLANHAQVYVVAGNKDLGSETPMELVSEEWICTTNGVHVQYVDPQNLSGKFWSEKVAEINPTHIHLNSLYSWKFSLLPLLASKSNQGAKLVLAPRGMLGQAARSIKPQKKRLFLGASKLAQVFKGIIWHASTQLEADEVLDFLPNANVRIAQDLPSPAPSETPSRLADSWNIAVIGRIHRVKNLHFGLKAVLEAKTSRPVTVNFIGPVEDATYQEELERLATNSPAVRVVFHGGMPPSELGPHFHAAHYLLSSTTQENFGHSIVEAWAHGCPVIISDRTPWRDLKAHNVGWDWPLDESEWNAGLNAALTLNHAEWEAKSRAARAYFSERVQSAEAEQANLALFDL